MTVKDLLIKFKAYGPVGFYNGVKAELTNNLRALYKNTYSQGEEDLFIDQFLDYKKRGFYVDVGAYDPHRLSNTKRFYKKGWTGINIEPNVSGYKKFLNKRPKDINLNIGIGSKTGVLTFYQFSPDTLSTFSATEAKYYIEMGYQNTKKYKIKVKPLDEVLQKHAPDKDIDFLNVDAEGLDLEVLKSNDWKRFRPKLVCIEAYEHCLQDDKPKNSELEDFLVGKAYKKVFENEVNAIFVDTKYKPS